MTRSGNSSLMPWLIIGVIAVIVFGSLYPFNLSGRNPDLISAFSYLSWARASHTDQMLNLLMYAPLGFCTVLWLKRTVGSAWSLLLSCAVGMLLSLSMEVTQVYFERVPSYMDIVMNTVGTLLGVIFGLTWGSLTRLIALPDNVQSQPGDRNALLVVLLWILWRLIDASFHVNLAHFKMVMYPVLHIEISWLLMLRYLLLWLVASLAVLSYASRPRGNEALLSMIGVIVIGRVLFVSPAFDSSELLALLLLLPALIVVHALRWIPATIIVLCALFTLYICDHVLPLNIGIFHASFDAIPFVSWAKEGFALDINALLHMLFLFAAMIWLLKAAGLSLRITVMLVVMLLVGIEVLHLWQAGRTGSITRPALALCVGLLTMAIDRSGSHKGNL
jgi:VanZ family protein